MENKRVRTALISVYHKEGLEILLDALRRLDVKILSTGGTYDWMEKQGYSAVKIEDLTGFPSILGGRVKTLHPKVFGGILGRPSLESDQLDMDAYGIDPIDMVVVDLYPFAEKLQQEGIEHAADSQDEFIELVDIGGVSLLRAAAKNYQEILSVCQRDEYPMVAEMLSAQDGITTLRQRALHARRTMQEVARYDLDIATFYGMAIQGTAGQNGEKDGSPTCAQHPLELPNQSKQLLVQTINSDSVFPLRYGENPHQAGSFLGNLSACFTQLSGKELSYNNLLDIDAGWHLVEDIETAYTVGIIKHGTPCGLASADTVLAAFEQALAGDPVSAFGGIIVTNGTVDSTAAQAIDRLFFEVCLAPSYSPVAIEILSKRKNRILLQRDPRAIMPPVQIRTALTGFLVQQPDTEHYENGLGHCVTEKQPSEEQLRSLRFAMLAAKHCKSNAIAIAKGRQLIGSSAGETSRVDAVRHAIEKAERFGFSLKGAVLASDGFFPFRDSVELAMDKGIYAFVQPGGSVRDEESIAACNARWGIMVFTGKRHFKH